MDDGWESINMMEDGSSNHRGNLPLGPLTIHSPRPIKIIQIDLHSTTYEIIFHLLLWGRQSPFSIGKRSGKGSLLTDLQMAHSSSSYLNLCCVKILIKANSKEREREKYVKCWTTSIVLDIANDFQWRQKDAHERMNAEKSSWFPYYPWICWHRFSCLTMVPFPSLPSSPPRLASDFSFICRIISSVLKVKLIEAAARKIDGNFQAAFGRNKKRFEFRFMLAIKKQQNLLKPKNRRFYCPMTIFPFLELLLLPIQLAFPTLNDLRRASHNNEDENW